MNTPYSVQMCLTGSVLVSQSQFSGSNLQVEPYASILVMHAQHMVVAWLESLPCDREGTDLNLH